MKLETVGRRIRATWPRYSLSIHNQIIERLRSIGAEFDSEGKCWWVKPTKADALLELFPGASFDYDVICAATDAGQRRNEAFCKFLASAGVELRCDDSGGVVAVGENVSPLLAEIVAQRFGKPEPKLEQARLL